MKTHRLQWGKAGSINNGDRPCHWWWWWCLYDEEATEARERGREGGREGGGGGREGERERK